MKAEPEDADYEVVDVVIVGGGPAGSSLGRLLSQWGHRVLLLARPIDRARGLAESIPPSARKLLMAVGVFDVIEQVVFAPNRGNVVWWAGAEPRVESLRPRRNRLARVSTGPRCRPAGQRVGGGR